MYYVADMVDTTKAYVYIGEETGMQTNHWYYYDGSDWVVGGLYNSVAVDKTLLVSNKAADAAITGNKLSELQGFVEDIYTKVNQIEDDVDTLSVRADSFFNELEVTSSGLVYGSQDGNRLNGPYGPFAGNGGGSGGGSGDTIDAVFEATNTTTWNNETIAYGDTIDFTFNWSSIENDLPSGRGSVTITVNNIVKATLTVNQGDVTIKLSKSYYSAGANKIRIRIADQYDQGKSWIVNLNAV